MSGRGMIRTKFEVCPEESDKFASCWNRNGDKHIDSGARLSLNAGSAALHVTVG